MRVFSTFSGISAATAAWKPLGWEFVGYAEVNPHACAVLAARCGATRPKYIPYAERAYLQDESWELLNRLTALEPKRGALVRRYADPDVDFDSLNELDRHEVHHRLHGDLAEHMYAELERRETFRNLHRRTRYEANGDVPNFGDIWSITDEDLEALGPIDILEGGSPCQAFSAAGSKKGMMDFRSALMLAYLDLVERMRRINGLQWVLWENVRDVLRDKGNGFGHLLGRLVEHGGRAVGNDGIKYANAGYVSGPDGAVAWRLLHSQRFGRPQRRERVFALAHVGMGAVRRDPREVLFEPLGDRSAPARAGTSSKKVALSISGRRIEDVPESERLVIFMAGQSPAAFSIAESTTTSPTLKSAPSGTNSIPRVAYAVPDGAGGTRYIVRKVLPVEAERLQGFPDHWTAVEVNGEVMADDERHAGLGNSMTVDVMRWIGERLDGATREDRVRDVAVQPGLRSDRPARSSAPERPQLQLAKLPPAPRLTRRAEPRQSLDQG